MCFPATASFVLSSALVPAGIYTIAIARSSERAWLAFAAFPLAFGLQQGLEGLVWLGIAGDSSMLTSWASRGFLFFSHLFWLTWVPISTAAIEQNATRRRFLVALTGIGFLFGLSVFLPSFLFGDWLAVELVNGSLEYRTRLIYDGIVNRTVLRIIYAALVVGALLLSSDIRIKAFGGVIAGSLIVTYAFYAYAFISVWCFFAAVLSAYLILVIHQNERRLPARDEPGRANLHG